MSVAFDNSSPTYPQNESRIDPTMLSSTCVSAAVSNSSNDSIMSTHCRLTKSLSSSSLALTPKTHNKRTRRRMEPSNSDSKSSIYSCSDSFDCNSLRRSLKRVRLTNQSSCHSPPSKSSTSPSSLLCASASRSPGEIRLHKDIQHAVLMQNWRPILPRLQLRQRYEIEPEKLDDERHMEKMVAQPNRSLLIPNPLDFNKISENSFCGDDESDDDDDDDAWRLPSYSYSVDNDVLQAQQPLFKTSHYGSQNDDLNQSVVNINRQISVKVFRKSYDPMHIILQVTINDDMRGKRDSQDSVVVLLQLHFPRLYPHQPPIVRRIDNFSLNSSSRDDDHNPIMKAFLAKSSSLQMLPAWGPASSSSLTNPTIWIASSPSECSGYLNKDSISDNSKTIVLTQWTPVSRLSDIIEMLVHAVCRHFCRIFIMNSIVDGQSSDSMPEVNESHGNGSSALQFKQLFCADETKDDEKRPTLALNIDKGSFNNSYKNDDASSTTTNLTPTMSNATRRQNVMPRKLQSLHSPQLDDDWKLSHSDEEANSHSDQQFLYFQSDSFNDNMRYRSPCKAATASDDEFDDDEKILQDLNEDDDELADAVEYNSMSVQYNRSCSASSYSSSGVSCHNGTDRIVDVIFPVSQAFPPGRFNQGYNNTNDNESYKQLSTDKIENNTSLPWYSNASPPNYRTSRDDYHKGPKQNDAIMMHDDMMSTPPRCLNEEDDTSMMDF